MRKHGWAATSLGSLGLGGLVLLLAACGPSSTAPGSAYGASSSSPTASPMSTGSAGGSTSGMGASGTVTLTIKKTAIGDVLADAKGDTLYWYAKDMKGGPSTCTGSCLAAWPAVSGKPAAAMGVTFAGKLGSVADAERDGAGHLQRIPALPLRRGHGAGADVRQRRRRRLARHHRAVPHVDVCRLRVRLDGLVRFRLVRIWLRSGSCYGSASTATAPPPALRLDQLGLHRPVAASGSDAARPVPDLRGSGSTGNSASKNNPAPAPSPTSSINGGGCGSGSCW